MWGKGGGDGGGKLVDSFEYEVFGKVQKVGFRVFMNKTMLEINRQSKDQTKGLLSAKAENTPENTVKGIVYGGSENLKKMKHWLENVGSPRSIIERCEYSNERKNVKRLIVGFETNRLWPLWLSPDFCPALCTDICVPIAKHVCGEGTMVWKAAKIVAKCFKGKKRD